MAANAIINYKSIQEKVFASTAYQRHGGAAATRKARNFFIPRKKKFMAEFYNHPVSREIAAGKNAGNTSGVIVGDGNLFSFIGFNSGDRPVETLGAFLDSFINLERFKYNKKKGEWSFRIHLPDQQDVTAVSSIPWQPGSSWAYEIEKGISGIGNFIQTNSIRSRSGGGIQVKNQIRTPTPTRAKYLKTMLRDLRRGLKR
jgi:hypothetical protein